MCPSANPPHTSSPSALPAIPVIPDISCHGHQRRPFQQPRPSAVNHPCHQESHNSRPGYHRQPFWFPQYSGPSPGLSVPPRLAMLPLLSLLPLQHPAEPASLLTASVPIILRPVQQLLPQIYYQKIIHALPHIAHVCSKIIVMSPERVFNHRII